MDAKEIKRESASAALSRSRPKVGSVGIVTTLVYLWLRFSVLAGSPSFSGLCAEKRWHNHPRQLPRAILSALDTHDAAELESNDLCLLVVRHE
jgi:hypothetical protein